MMTSAGVVLVGVIWRRNHHDHRYGHTRPTDPHPPSRTAKRPGQKTINRLRNSPGSRLLSSRLAYHRPVKDSPGLAALASHGGPLLRIAFFDADSDSLTTYRKGQLFESFTRRLIELAGYEDTQLRVKRSSLEYDVEAKSKLHNRT